MTQVLFRLDKWAEENLEKGNMEKKEIVISAASYNISQALRPIMDLSDKSKEQWNDIMHSMAKAMSSAAVNFDLQFNSNAKELLNHFSDIEKNYANIVVSSGIASIQIHDALKSFTYQTKALEQLTLASQTALVSVLKGCIATANIKGCIDATKEALGRNMVHASDLALINSTALGRDLKETLNLSDSIQHALTNVNALTSRALISAQDVMYNPDSKIFTAKRDKDSDVRVNISEMNSIGYAYTTINDNIADGEHTDDYEFVTAKELMNFMTELSECRSFGSESPVGKKIFDMISSRWNQRRYNELDGDFYYHARPLEKDGAPYVFQEMLRAPHGVTGPGRYNYPGEAYYYTADTADGATKEIKKHNRDKEIQVVKLKPRGQAKLLDLSVPMRWGKEFLKYIRFDASGNIDSKMPREYLIPNFVSDCCRKVGFDGIKYYGEKDYNNYVTWRDGFYYYVCMM